MLYMFVGVMWGRFRGYGRGDSTKHLRVRQVPAIRIPQRSAAQACLLADMSGRRGAPQRKGVPGMLGYGVRHRRMRLSEDTDAACCGMKRRGATCHRDKGVSANASRTAGARTPWMILVAKTQR